MKEKQDNEIPERAASAICWFVAHGCNRNLHRGRVSPAWRRFDCGDARAVGRDLVLVIGACRYRFTDNRRPVVRSHSGASASRADEQPGHGHSDALLHSFDADGRAFMAYVETHGSFHDVPVKFLMREMERLYPGMMRGKVAGRDMEREASAA